MADKVKGERREKTVKWQGKERSRGEEITAKQAKEVGMHLNFKAAKQTSLHI